MKTSTEDFDAAFGAVAGYFAALSEPARLKIMHVLCRGERTVNRIAEETGISQTSVSRHLALMHRHGLTQRRRDGQQVRYRIADETMPEVCRAVCNRIAKAADARRPLRRSLLALVPPPGRRAA